ncbi:nucleolar protein,Nop52-domain-containing protein [Neocallimastix lanati (nom. inval.)]|nr:nucleolar protein,Nop52-domain-containing protein [Neocallimastix sp. JGI-2020a]
MTKQNSFGKALASTDKKVRNKAVKRLSKYLSNKKDLSDIDLIKLWKGLFSCLWISDSPLIQQQLSEKLASLILKIPDEIVIKYIESFWKEIRLEWTNINKLRLDKLNNIFRQIHFNSFKFLEKVNWDITHVIKYMNIYIDGPLSLLDETVPPSLLYHVCEVFLPELDNAISKPIPSSVFIKILEPFFDVIGFCSNGKLVEKVVEELFINIANIYENEDSNNEDKSNIVKSCNFKGIYERLKKINDDPHALKKNIENIENLIITFKGIFETQGILHKKEEEEDNDVEIIKEDENESKVKKIKEIIIEEEKLKTNSKRKTTKKAVKKAKNKTTKKEQPIEIVEDKKLVKKGSKKRKAEIEPIEINEENEDHIEVIELPKKKRKISARAANKEVDIKIKSKSKSTKDKINEEVTVVTELDEENKLESSIVKNIKKNNKKSKNSKNSKISKDKDVTSLKSKNNNDNKDIKDKKIKTSKSKEKNRSIETITSISSSKTINTDLSSIKIPIASLSQTESIITIDETSTTKKSKANSKSKLTKSKNKAKKSINNKKVASSSAVIDIVETSPKIMESNKIIKKTKSANKKKKKSEKKRNEELTKEEEAFVNKILRESHLINDKSESIFFISSPHPTTIERIPEKITIESLMQTDSAIKRKF